MPESKQLSQLDANSIQISTHCQAVRIDDATEKTEQRYLQICGSPDGFRWLARHFNSLAQSAEKHGSAANIVAPWDFNNAPIELADWDSLEFHCGN